MDYVTTHYQPLNVFFDLKLYGAGGNILYSQIYIYPQIPIDFNISHKTTAGGELSPWSMTLFDSSGIEIEPYLWLARSLVGLDDPHVCDIRYGYTDLLHSSARVGGEVEFSSPWIASMLNSYSVTIQNNGFMLSLEGTTTGSTVAKANNQYRGNILEILQLVSNKHNLVINVNPEPDKSKIKVPDQTNNKTTEYVDAQFIKYLNEPDIRFIAQLCQNLVTPDGRSGYTLYYVPKDGQDVLNIMMPDAVPLEYEYKVQDKDSVVVEWAPDINFTLGAALDGDWVKKLGYQTWTGEEVKQTMNTIVSEPRLPNIGTNGASREPPVVIRCWDDGKFADDPKHEQEWCAEHMDLVNCSNGLRARGGGTLNPSQGFFKYLTSFLHGQLNEQTGTLTVLGDPRLMGDAKVKVIYFYPNSLNSVLGTITDGLLHYTSGWYFCEEVRHAVSMGKYLTIMSLRRDPKETKDGFQKLVEAYSSDGSNVFASKQAVESRTANPEQPGPNPISN